MAKSKFGQENKLYPAGILVLHKNVEMPDGKVYDKIYCSYWDVILNSSDLPKEKSGNWTWHAFKGNECVFHITGNHVSDLIENGDPNIEGVYVV
jgi:hypothetical protein